MSLKAFHVLFIALSILLSMMVGGWGVRQYLAEQSATGLAVGVVFFASGFGLLWYGLRFLHKIEELGI